MNKVIYFISKDARWQKYRNDILTLLSKKQDVQIEILTIAPIEPYLSVSDYISYKTFTSWLPKKIKPSFFPGALWYIIKNKPYAVLCLDNTSQITEYCVFLLCKIINIKFIWWTHAFDHFSPKSLYNQMIKPIYRTFFLRHGDSIITFSENGRKYLINRGVESNKIFTAPNTLDTNKLLQRKSEKKLINIKDIKKNLGLKLTSRVIIFSGRLSKRKKIDYIIKALPYIKEKINNIILVIIGDGEESNTLCNLALNLNMDVKFLGEEYDEDILANWFAVSEIYIMPGWIGLSIVHAFCYGLPIITLDRKEHAPEFSYFKNNYNGIIIGNNDEKELAKQVIKLLLDSSKLKEMSHNALLTIKKDANINLMLDKMSRAIFG